jgi:hypothetical protein
VKKDQPSKSQDGGTLNHQGEPNDDTTRMAKHLEHLGRIAREKAGQRDIAQFDAIKSNAQFSQGPSWLSDIRQKAKKRPEF